MATTTQTRDVFLQALKHATVELDDSDLGLLAELATRLATALPLSRSDGSTGRRRPSPPAGSRSAGPSDREAKPRTVSCPTCDTSMSSPVLGQATVCPACGASYTRDSTGIVRLD